MATMSLPIDLASKNGLDAFFKAIDDPANRSSIADTNLPAGAKEVIDLVNDPHFQGTAVPLGRRIYEHRRAVALGQDTPNAAFTKQVIHEGEQLRTYLNERYPEGVKLLTQFAELQQPAALAGVPMSEADFVAANVSAVVNAGVWANVAAVTNAVVAAEVAAVIGLVAVVS